MTNRFRVTLTYYTDATTSDKTVVANEVKEYYAKMYGDNFDSVKVEEVKENG